MRNLLVLLVLGCGSGMPTVDAADDPMYAEIVKPFLTKHCTKCHGPKKQESDLRLDNLPIDLRSHPTMAHWEEILSQLHSGQMPPEAEPRPEPEQTARVADWIAQQLREAETVQQLAAGQRVTFHKLSREEYENTIHDLLGVTFDATASTGLPEDPDWHGFERIGSVLTTSPAHIERYLVAAETILDEALSLRPVPQRETIRWEAFDMRWQDFRQEYEARGIADQVRIEIVPNNYTTDTWNVAIKTTGDYLLRIKLSGLRPEGGRAPRLKVYLPSINKTLLEQDVDAPEQQPITLAARVHLVAGEYPVRLINAVPGPSPESRRSRHSGTAIAFTTTRSRVPWQLKLTDDDFQPIQPTLIVDSVQWDGPIVDSWPTAAHRRVFFKGDSATNNMDYAREILARFAARAWRRPVQPEEIERLMQPVLTAHELGDSFASSVRSGLVAVLCAKGFLYLEQGNVTTSSTRLNDYELASRLSYFLWSTMPDERLMKLAKSSTLHQTDVLSEEVRRMLNDARSQAFAQSFPRQWLHLRKVGMFPPDRELYPEYDEHLEQSLIAETIGFFGEVLKRNASLREFVDSDWTMLNQRLAQHYGIEDVRGDELRRVSLRREDHRGGLLTHGSVLSLTSDGTRHRPVHRGVWILESILGKPPAPPPANVPALGTPEATAKKTTLRDKLELHRSDENCRACHRKIDPLGIAFDNYDAIGRWRTVETVRDGAGSDPALDPSGVLADGRAFADSVALRRLLLDRDDEVAVAFAEKLAMYALRRGMTFSDRDGLQRIVKELQATDYPLRSLVEAFVTSPLFQKW